MTNPIGLGLAVAASATFAFANGGPNGNDKPLLDNLFQGTKVTYTPGKGITFDGGDEYAINLGGRIQAGWYYLALDGAAEDTQSFQVRRARTKISGHLWNKDTTFYLQNDHTGGTSILDAWANWAFYKGEEAELGLRVGLGKFHSSRQFDGSSGKLEFIDRAVATRMFSGTRATGAVVEGSALGGDDGNMLHFYFGATNNDQAAGALTSGAETNNVGDNELDWIFGARIDPQGDMGDLEWSEGDLDHSGKLQSSLGVNVTIGNDNVGAASIENTTINVNAAVKTGSGIAAQGEVFLRSDDAAGAAAEADSNGWYVQGSYTTPQQSTQWGFAGRFGMVSIDDANALLAVPGMNAGQANVLGGATGDVLEIQGVVSAYYHKHALKTQFGYTFQDVDPDTGTSSENHSLDVQFTVSF